MLTEKDYTALYPRIKMCVIKYEHNGNERDFDEDVFHETAMKCLQLMRGKRIGISEEEISKYFCKAYHINLIRNKLYGSSQHEFPSADPKSKQCVSLNSMADTHLITQIICRRFSRDLELLFRRHICQEIPIAQLESESGINNLKYQFSKIKDFLRQTKVIQELKVEFGYN